MSSPDRVDQLDRFQHLEVEAQQHHMDDHDVQARGSGPQQAAVRAFRLERPRGGRDLLGRLLQRHQQADHRVCGVRAGGDAPGDIGGEVVGGRLAGDETRPVRRPGRDAVRAEGAPVLAVEIPGDQVPAALGTHQAVRFDGAPGGRAVVPPVLEAQPLGVPAEVSQLGQHRGVDGVRAGAAQHRHGEGVQGAHAAAQPVRKHLFQLGEGPYGGLADALDALSGGGAQPDGDGHGLLVVQQQRRQFRARAQLVAAAGARTGVDGIAEFAEPVHVPAHGAGADPEPSGQIGAGPLAVGLEQGQQTQQTCRGLQHGGESARPSGQSLS
ncbi:hypothetical protein GCM10010297_66140 [Streptomyces malachitofuscus]|nr:hypothetical protein GCM10010297_66140 [Streptomyces malachitofuscus]